MRRSLLQYLLGCSLGCLGMVSSSCARDVPPTAPPLCYLSTLDPAESHVADDDDDDDEEAAAQPLSAVTATQWRQLIVGSTDGQASSDCSGRAIERAPTAPSCEAEPSSALVPLELSDDSVTVKRIGTDERLVFVRTHTMGDEVVGVVALVQQDHRGLSVKALGHLRSQASRIRLSLEQVGERQLVVADGEVCEGTVCTRDARFLVRNDDRLTELPVYLRRSPTAPSTTNRTCLGPPVVAMERHRNETLESGWLRTFQLAASWEVSGEGLLIHERVEAEDTDPHEPGSPPTAYREVNAERTWTLGTNEWVASERALLGRTMIRMGQIDVPNAD